MNHPKRNSYIPFHPPPEDGPKESKSNIADGEGTDSKISTRQIIMIPTRYLGVSICLKEVS